jgi:hypothetical protein
MLHLLATVALPVAEPRYTTTTSDFVKIGETYKPRNAAARAVVREFQLQLRRVAHHYGHARIAISGQIGPATLALFAAVQADAGDYVMGDASTCLGVAQNAPMTLTQAPYLESRLLGRGLKVATRPVTSGHGMLETYTCLRCGYVEWYCQQPLEIPIGPEYMSELIDYTPTAPHR